MSSTFFLTDGAAQFLSPSFPGKRLLRTLPYDLSLGGVRYPEGKNVKVVQFPEFLVSRTDLALQPPAEEALINLLSPIAQTYDDVCGIFSSSYLSGIYEQVAKALTNVHGRSVFHLVDSLTTSVGLGALVQKAASQAIRGVPIAQIEHSLRLLIPHIYFLVCAPGLSYMRNSNFIDNGQAIVGDLLNLYPIFSMEEGHLNPFDKVRNPRSVLEFFIEFIDEFDNLETVCFLQSQSSPNPDSRMIKQHLDEFYSDTHYAEYPMNLPLAAMLGPASFGIVIVEKIAM